MPQTVLVVPSRPAASRACFDAAAYVASILDGARILAARTIPKNTAIPGVELVTTSHQAEMARRNDAEDAVLQDAFAKWQQGYTGAAEWAEASDDVATHIARFGGDIALVVTSAQAGPHDKQVGALHAAILDTGRPVLIVPDEIGPSLGQRIAVAWHDDAPATHAVLSALPFLATAEHIWLLQCVRSEGIEPPPVPPLFDAHQIVVEPRVIFTGHREVGEALLDEAKAVGADLMVMGAYAHRRMIEALLGGVTHSMLHTADLPLLMRH